MSGFRYIIYCLFYTLCLVGAIVPVNYAVDPYGIYLYKTAWDWPHARPALTDQPFMHKAHMLQRVNADILLMGSSRVAWGMNPYSPSLPTPAYNAALAGGRVYETWRYLQHASAVHMPAMVLLGVESSFFVPGKPNSTFSEDRLSVQPDGRIKPYYAYAFADAIPTLVSLSTFKLSLQSLFTKNTDKYDFSGGFSPEKTYFWFPWSLASVVLGTNAKSDVQWVDESGFYRGADGKAPEMDAFEHIVSFCARNHIRLIIFVNPLHAVTLDKLTQHWDNYGAWMKALLTNADASSGSEVEFWDFAGYDSISTEPFPLLTDGYSHMHFWLDRCHYRQNVGDMVLQRIFTAQGPQEFGRRVTASTLDQDLTRLKAEKEAWHTRGQAVLIPEAIVHVQASVAK